jgi:hypothetical protein
LGMEVSSCIVILPLKHVGADGRPPLLLILLLAPIS